MAEHHNTAQPVLCLHGLKGQQGAKGLPRSRACMHENVASMAAARLEPSPQQLDQLLLPDPRANRGDPRLGTQLKRRAGDGTELEDEAF